MYARSGRFGRRGADVADAELPEENLDLTAVRREYIVAPPAFLRSLLLSVMANEADLPIAYLMLNIVCSVLPSAALLFMVPNDDESWLKIGLGVAHLALVFGVFLQRFVLMLHFSEHRAVWTGPTAVGAKVLNNLNPVVLAPFFGMPSGMYYLHHVVMHHIENNVFPYDVSSTMPYQRDNFLHFLHYWVRFVVAAWIELPYYAFFRKRYLLCVGSLSCALFYIWMITSLWAYDSVATTFVFLIPFGICSFALMFGNWSQHIFIDPDRPFSNYALTYNCMNTPENQLTFNDGYHINHHIHSRLHWTQLAENFCDKLGKFAAEDAFVFTGLGFFDVGLYTMTGQLHKLAKHYVHYGQVERSDEEVVEEFKRRLVPIPC
mmetsp:Transcript_136720/g.332361  ORF Transcript_136720/g.332361 Transcript_136720/m.332361 type:complete len:376 (+) Transcript_136720:279-1406(+)